MLNNPYAPSSWSCIDEKHRASIANLDNKFEQFVWKLKRCEISKSTELVSSTVDLLDQYIGCSGEYTTGDVMKLIREIGRVLHEIRSIELIVGNTVRQVLQIIECESANMLNNHNNTALDRSLDSHHIDNTDVFNIPLSSVQEVIQDEVTSLIFAVTNVDSALASHALPHFYSNEVILTMGYSRTVLNFLKKAHKSQRKFEVLVAESSPLNLGHKMALSLANAGITSTVISDSAVNTIIPSVSKVVIGTHAVLANGGLVGNSGMQNICYAALHKSIPVLVLTGTQKLTPLYALDIDTFNEQACPSQIIDFNEVREGNVEVLNPAYDYIEPNLVTLIITDEGAFAPSFVCKILNEQYTSEYHKFE